MESSEQQVSDKTKSFISDERIVVFSEPHTKEGMAWGIEVDLDISDRLPRSRFYQSGIEIPRNITKITYLDLAPQEALPKKLRTIRSKVPTWQSELKAVSTPVADKPKLKNLLHTCNVMMPQDEKRFSHLADMIIQAANKDELLRKFNQLLAISKGDSLVIVHGHSYNLSEMGEQYPDLVYDETGKVIQKAGNRVSLKDILDRYNDPNKFSAIVLNGCNHDGVSIKADKVPVLYPLSQTKFKGGGMIWDKSGGLSAPNSSEGSF